MCFTHQAVKHPANVTRRSDPVSLWRTVLSLTEQTDLIDTLRQDLTQQLQALRWNKTYRETLQNLLQLSSKHLTLTSEPFLEKTLMDKIKSLMKTLQLPLQSYILVDTHFRSLLSKKPPLSSADTLFSLINLSSTDQTLMHTQLGDRDKKINLF